MNDLLREIFSCGRFFVGMFLLVCLKNMVYCIEHDVMKDFCRNMNARWSTWSDLSGMRKTALGDDRTVSEMSLKKIRVHCKMKSDTKK